MEKLTEEEVIAVFLMARGEVDKVIASMMNSAQPNGSYTKFKAAIFDKLGAIDRTNAVALAIVQGQLGTELLQRLTLPKPKSHLLEILELWGAGFTAAQIAKKTSRTEGTVIYRLEEVKRDLGSKDRWDAYRIAKSCGFVH